MTIDLDEVRQNYARLSDAALLAVNRDELVLAAQGVYDEEIDRRGLRAAGEPVVVEGEVVEEAPTEEGVVQDLVAVGTYTVVDEARFARGLLQGAQIPCGLTNDPSDPGALLLMVPENEVEAALEVLAGEISDEELAAQAEAAGLHESPLDEE